MSRRVILGAVIAMGADITGCGDKDGDSADVTCDREPALDWGNFGEGYMGLHCTGCHSVLYPEYLRSGAPENVNFNTYYDVVTYVHEIEILSTGENPSMPPSGGPTEAELALFQEWLTCAVWPDHDALEEAGKL